MSPSERLHDLLPAEFRARDADVGSPLRALLGVLEQELDSLRDEVESLYDNWFVETCEEWLVPYLGQLVGAHGLRDVTATGFSLRGFVANAVARRRRKGTAAATEQVARDVTGYPVRAQELFAITATTVADDHLRGQDRIEELAPAPPRNPWTRTGALGTVDLRDVPALVEIGGAFDHLVHTADLRGPDGSAHPNLPNLALHLFRTAIQPLGWVAPRPVAGPEGLFDIDPAGRRRPLFTRPRAETDIAALAGPQHVPRPLGRLELDQLVHDGGPLPVRVRTTDDDTTVELTVEACDLSAGAGGGAAAYRPEAGTAAVDPVSARVALHADDLAPGHRVEVSSAYGFPGSIGAGPHDRTNRLAAQLHTGAGGTDEIVAPTRTWWVAAAETAPPDPDQVATLADAVDQWNTFVTTLPEPDRAATVGLVVLADDRSHAAPDPIQLPDGARLHLVAARRADDDGLGELLEGAVAAGVRPHVVGELAVVGTGTGAAARLGGLACSGLLVDGRVRALPGDLDWLDLADCTVLPPQAGGATDAVLVEHDDGAANARLELRLAGAVLAGPVRSQAPIASLHLRDSLITAEPGGATGSSSPAIDLAGATVDLGGSSVVGRIRARTLEASDCILDPGAGAPAELLDLAITQQGCLRYSWVPDETPSPRRHRCQPDRALAALSTDPDLAADPVAMAAARRRVRARLQPRYAGTDLGDPGLHLLTADTDPALKTAAGDGGEPGVWHHLEHANRLANLDAVMRTDLRFGLRAGVVEHV